MLLPQYAASAGIRSSPSLALEPRPIALGAMCSVCLCSLADRALRVPSVVHFSTIFSVAGCPVSMSSIQTVEPPFFNSPLTMYLPLGFGERSTVPSTE